MDDSSAQTEHEIAAERSFSCRTPLGAPARSNQEDKRALKVAALKLCIRGTFSRAVSRYWAAAWPSMTWALTTTVSPSMTMAIWMPEACARRLA